MFFAHYKHLMQTLVRRVELDEDFKVRYSVPWANPLKESAAGEVILPDCGVAMRKVTRPFRFGKSAKQTGDLKNYLSPELFPSFQPGTSDLLTSFPFFPGITSEYAQDRIADPYATYSGN